ncbi:MAG: acetate--CoA ligase family protein [Actinobacteria bacterium]|jgi:succinyl-CoA synthetase beta subunit|nr:acetate--CoA ligase family protein [Actinomycetota bacterium]
MVRFLLESDAKHILAGAGIPVPRGWALADVPAGLAGPLVAKVLVEEGGRAARGGVCRVPSRELLDAAAAAMLADWSGPPVQGIWVEEMVDGVQHELYLAISINRHRCVPTLLVADGGTDVESRTAVSIDLPPDGAWRQYAVHRMREVMGFDGEVAARVGEIARSMLRVVVEQRAELVEVNPLALRSNDAVALDAKVVLPAARPFEFPVDGTALGLVAGCRRMGVNAALGDGKVAVVTSGAGLLLATVDLLSQRRVELGAMVDLGGAVFGDGAGIADIIRMTAETAPAQILCNYFMQFVSCATVAEHIVRGLEASAQDPATVVVRQRGREQDRGREILEAAGCTVLEDLEQACDLVARVDAEALV